MKRIVFIVRSFVLVDLLHHMIFFLLLEKGVFSYLHSLGSRFTLHTHRTIKPSVNSRIGEINCRRSIVLNYPWHDGILR